MADFMKMLQQAQELAQRAMGNLTGGLNLPFKLPF